MPPTNNNLKPFTHLMSKDSTRTDDFIEIILSQRDLNFLNFVKDYNPHFVAPKSTHTLNPENTTLNIQRTLDSIVSSHEQNIFQWAKEFFESASLCGWDEQSQLAVLRTTIYSNFHATIDFTQTPIEVIKLIFRLKYNQV